jgi:peptidoglycan/LPS O-acetylase OafA/YrhL
VVLHHTIEGPSPVNVLFSFGQEAVLVFFLLSGFVIFANEKTRVHRPGGYYLRRLRRIYPPMIVAMLVSTALWGLGLIDVEFSWKSLIGTLLALQDIDFLKPGVITDPYLGNDPLWSLSYEVFFYATFPLAMILWRRSIQLARWAVPTIAVVAYLSFLAWPNHFSLVLAYFLMWWVGAMAAHLYTRGEMQLRNAVPELLGLTALAGAAALGVGLFGPQGAGYFPVLILRHCLTVLALFVVLFTPIRHWMSSLSLEISRPVAAVAGISYGLYVVHYPLLVQTGANQSLWIIPAAALTVTLAWLADKVVPSLLPRAPRD